MTVHELAQTLGLKTCCLSGAEGREVTGGYCGDLLSWVMSRAKRGDAWLTVMGNVNAVAVASLTDAACIILCEGAELDEAARNKAQENGVVVFQTDGPAYELALKIGALLN